MAHNLKIFYYQQLKKGIILVKIIKFNTYQ